MRGGAMRGGLVAALAMSALATGAGVASAASAPGPADDNLFVRRPGRDRGDGGHRGKPGRSIADQPHDHEREIARRKRQAERNAERRFARLAKRAKRRGVPLPVGAQVGISRRGNPIVLDA